MTTPRPDSTPRVRRAALAAACALLAALVLAACGGGINSSESKQVEQVKTGPVKGKAEFSNWPLYIDPNNDTIDKRNGGTVKQFEKQTGVQVKYVEEINDNNEFFGKVRQQLADGKSGGRSMFVVTDWMAGKMAQLGYLQKLDKSVLPNVAKNLLPSLRKTAADPHRDYTVPWQTGLTGLIVRTDKAPDVKSIADVFDPKYKGHVTMLSELRDTVPMVMLSMGKDPEKAPKADWLAAIKKIQQANDSGQIRQFTGNDYTKSLTKGDAWISFGWSGDAVQLQADNKNIKFVQPKEGLMIWSDDMVVPVGSPNPAAAEAFMNYVYDPEVQADIADYVNYVTPVNGVKPILEKKDPAVAKDNLIFPSQSFLKNTHSVRQLSPSEDREINAEFEKVIGN